MTGIILSGGKSTRMEGRNKAFMEVHGERLIDRTVRLFRDIFGEIIVVTNSALDYLDQDVKIVTDIVKGKGALGGIHAGLFFSSSEHAFVAACDMPFLNQAFIRYMVNQAVGYDVVVPETEDGLQPLHAVYSRRCMQGIIELLEKDECRVKELYKKVRTLKIKKESILSYDPEFHIFSNINTPEDWKKLFR